VPSEKEKAATAGLPLAENEEEVSCLVGRGDLSAQWRHVHTATVLVELHLAVCEGEKGPITTRAYVLASDKFGAALAHKNAACGHELTAECLDAQAFGITVAAVPAAALSFFMCHNSLKLNLFNF
jgi:hypothetical protein